MAGRETLIDRFIKYAKVGTTSDSESKTIPSTPGQMELARIVEQDLLNAGADDVLLDKQGFIYATIKENLPANHPAKGKVPTIGYLSHLDTASEAPGDNVKPQIIKNYDGGNITFPANKDLELTPEINPKLKKCIGHTIITSDGTTLLGGDDKAGLAVIVELVHYYKEHPEELHGDIRLAIIPDEEIAVGAEKLDLKQFGADIAYTLDGGEIGEIDVESFNGFKATLQVEGYAAFPGYGKNIYLNASQIISKFVAAMNNELWPQNCDKRQPIWWVQKIEGEVAKASATIFLRDFDIEGIEQQKKMLNSIKETLLKDYPKAKIDLKVEEMYKNYRYELDKDARVVSFAEEAMKKIGITPIKNYVRGGNDSCHLCFNGLLSTNLFVGMQNFHSLMEWVSAQAIESSLKTVVSLNKVWMDQSAEK